MLISALCLNCQYESVKVKFKDFTELQKFVQNDGGYIGFHKGDKCPICKMHNNMKIIHHNKERLNMIITSKRKDNGKIVKQLEKKGSIVIGKFKCQSVNMFLTELKCNSPEATRKFTVSIRLDGDKENLGETKLTQMNFNEEELLKLKEEIQNLLDNK